MGAAGAGPGTLSGSLQPAEEGWQAGLWGPAPSLLSPLHCRHSEVSSVWPPSAHVLHHAQRSRRSAPRLGTGHLPLGGFRGAGSRGLINLATNRGHKEGSLFTHHARVLLNSWWFYRSLFCTEEESAFLTCRTPASEPRGPPSGLLVVFYGSTVCSQVVLKTKALRLVTRFTSGIGRHFQDFFYSNSSP